MINFFHTHIIEEATVIIDINDAHMIIISQHIIHRNYDLVDNSVFILMTSVIKTEKDSSIDIQRIRDVRSSKG